MDTSGHVAALVNAVRCLVNEIIHMEDGVTEVNTLDVELLERAAHNVDPSIRPSHPDKAAMPCAWDCQYCKDNDAGNI